MAVLAAIALLALAAEMATPRLGPGVRPAFPVRGTPGGWRDWWEEPDAEELAALRQREGEAAAAPTERSCYRGLG